MKQFRLKHTVISGHRDLAADGKVDCVARAVGDKELGMGMVALQRQARGVSEETARSRLRTQDKNTSLQTVEVEHHT